MNNPTVGVLYLSPKGRYTAVPAQQLLDMIVKSLQLNF